MISSNLQTLRKQRGYTQEMVAEHINVSRQAIAKWESGESLPDIERCIALAKLYDVSLDHLVGGEEADALPLIPPKGKHIFGTVTVGERGQIVIPKKARDVFHISPGDTLMILGDEALGGIAIIKADLFLQSIEPLISALPRAAKTKQEEDASRGDV